MKVRDIVDTCSLGDIFYSYTLGGMSRAKLVGVSKADHTALFLDLNTNQSYLAYDYADWYFKTPEEALKYRRNSLLTQIKRLQGELDGINRQLKA